MVARPYPGRIPLPGEYWALSNWSSPINSYLVIKTSKNSTKDVVEMWISGTGKFSDLAPANYTYHIFNDCFKWYVLNDALECAECDGEIIGDDYLCVACRLAKIDFPWHKEHER